MAKKIIKIKGMHCASCATLIERKLKKVQGVENANVNYATEKASVEFEEGLNENLLKEAIKSAGYDVIESDEEKGVLKLTISGMDTKFSTIQIKKILSKFKDAIIEGRLNINEKAEIVYDPTKINSREIINTIEELGYEITEETSLDREKEIKEKEIQTLKNLFMLNMIGFRIFH